MHEETYYGIKEIGKGEDKKVYKTLRTPIEKVKRKDLENIPDRLGGSKDIYETLVEWFGDYEVSREINHMLHFFIKSSFLPIDIL